MPVVDPYLYCNLINGNPANVLHHTAPDIGMSAIWRMVIYLEESITYPS